MKRLIVIVVMCFIAGFLFICTSISNRYQASTA
ncbi:hypothetical protein SODG_002395 [Sodalis praecaptivus]